MKIIRSISKQQIEKNTCLTIGNFDGVHLAHQQIIEQLIASSKQLNLASLIITFLPHPLIFLQHKKHLLLQTLAQKISILKQFPIDYLLILPFNQYTSKLSYQYFTKHILQNYCKVQKILLGYDFNFGNNKLGNATTLRQAGIDITEIPCFKQGNQIYSSSLARQYIRDGNIIAANNILTRNFAVTGVVAKGRQLARTLGFPTANIAIKPMVVLPKNGVYRTRTIVDGNIFASITNFGTKPTINNGCMQAIFETHLFNFNQDIYGKKIEILFDDFIRPEQKFNSLDELKQQIKIDINDAKLKI